MITQQYVYTPVWSHHGLYAHECHYSSLINNITTPERQLPDTYRIEKAGTCNLNGYQSKFVNGQQPTRCSVGELLHLCCIQPHYLKLHVRNPVLSTDIFNVIKNPFPVCTVLAMMLEHIRNFSSSTHSYNGHFPGQPALAGCPVNSQSPIILILSILTGQAKTLHILLFEVGRLACPQGTLGCSPPTYIT